MRTQKSLLCAVVSALVGTVCAQGSDVVIDWNSVALNAIRVDRTSPPRASRNLAILHVAIYDAVNGVTHTGDPYLVKTKAPGVASTQAAAAAAAHHVLIHLYPAQRTTFDAAYTASLAAIGSAKERSVTEGIKWGDSVAETILTARANDGSAAVVPYTPGINPGDWQPTPPAFAPALLPQWPGVTPFAMTSGAQFRPPPPPALASAAYAAELNTTKELGSITSATRTADQTSIAFFWADGAGTVTPPGHWNVIAQDVATQIGNDFEENARLFALLNIALADAAICSWDCKYAYNFWRPVTAIRNADLDGNIATEKDETWSPLLVTPPFPEYTSGHSTFSGAASTVLALFFGSDAIPFTTESEDLPGVTRSFNSFSEAAFEAGMSRIYGGIHFLSANYTGLSGGERIGAYVVENFLRDRPGKSERGK